ncbi:hypothetical protein C1H46_032223 [Malus baccata]|uniref:Uncharacterized protein n=1 Tax=Malus baccata TaxID=106549 RepID=A0A540L6U4_MALBA|nr:hypothetical protein C1H46_032223 [Malus baccata]
MLTSYLIIPRQPGAWHCPILSKGINFIIKGGLLLTSFRKNALLSFKDIREYYYHIETNVENGVKIPWHITIFALPTNIVKCIF